MKKQSFERALTALLDESIQSATRRERTQFDEMVAPSHGPLVLFGAGSLGRKVLACLRRHGEDSVALVDSNRDKWGTVVEGLSVTSPDEAARAYGKKSTFVVTIASPGHSYVQTQGRLVASGCDHVVPVLPLMWKYASELLPHYALERPSFFLGQKQGIVAAFHMMADEVSRRQFVAHVRMRLLARFEDLPEPEHSRQYFPDDVVSPRDDEVFVDGGAYDGDTIRAFLARSSCRSIHAFEPDPSNCDALRHSVEQLEPAIQGHIKVYQAALGKRRGLMRSSAIGTPGASASTTGVTEVDCVTLDGLSLSEPVTFIKLDLEGGERDALVGARRTIARHRPTVAVCVYHRPDDLWHIVGLLRRFTDGYSFFLRWHSYDGWETVLYAIPPDRMHRGRRVRRMRRAHFTNTGPS